MLNIILACQYGASTSIICNNIKQAAAELGDEVIVNAYSYTSIGEHIDSADIVLLGPQVRFQLNNLVKKYGDKNVPFMVIDTAAYGMVDGKKIYHEVKKTLEKERGS